MQFVAHTITHVHTHTLIVRKYGWTPLIVATRGNFADVVDLLLAHKANANACDTKGLSPLMTGECNKHERVEMRA